MAKEVIQIIKLQLPAGKANPAPPVGPALGQHGVNIMEFCKAFNGKTHPCRAIWGGRRGRRLGVLLSIKKSGVHHGRSNQYQRRDLFIERTHIKKRLTIVSRFFCR